MRSTSRGYTDMKNSKGSYYIANLFIACAIKMRKKTFCNIYGMILTNQ